MMVTVCIRGGQKCSVCALHSKTPLETSGLWRWSQTADPRLESLRIIGSSLMKSLPESNYKWNLLTLITRNWCRFSTGIMDTSIMRRWWQCTLTGLFWMTLAPGRRLTSVMVLWWSAWSLMLRLCMIFICLHQEPLHLNCTNRWKTSGKQLNYL